MADPIIQQIDALDRAADNAGEHKDALKQEIAKLREQYEQSTDDAQKKALAAALPGIAKGTLSAITAFRQGDAIGGSAAVMDILSGVSAAFGPEGAVIGALFSVISMILNFFAPKPPSLLEQIEKLLRNLEAEDWKNKLTAIGNGVKTYAAVCDQYMAAVDPTAPHQHGGVQDPGGLIDEINKVNLVEGNAALTIWTAQEWLENPANQELDAWPEILNLHCEMYMHLRLAVTRQYLYARDADRAKKYIDEPNKGWEDREAAWNGRPDGTGLWPAIDTKFRNMVQSDSYTQHFLTIIVPAARKRGLFIFAWQRSDLKVATGPKAFQEVKVDTLRGDCRRTSITPPRDGVSDPAALYDVWILDESERATHSTLNIQNRTLRAQLDDMGPDDDGNHHRFLDWWPLPKRDAAGTFDLYVVENWGGTGALELWEWNTDAASFNRIGWRPTTAKPMSQVRIVTPSATLPDDPDKGAMPDSFVNGDSIIYATIDDSTDIFVWANAQYSVPIPMGSYRGISVDPYFLWMYGRDGFACATHASVMSCILGKRQMPLWLGNGQPKNIADVLDLSSCGDGTLLVIAPGNQASTSVYSVEFNRPDKGEGEWLIIDNWETIPGGGGVQCQKLPIFGWSRIERLAAMLTQQAASSTQVHRSDVRGVRNGDRAVA